MMLNTGVILLCAFVYSSLAEDSLHLDDSFCDDTGRFKCSFRKCFYNHVNNYTTCCSALPGHFCKLDVNCCGGAECKNNKCLKLDSGVRCDPGLTDICAQGSCILKWSTYHCCHRNQGETCAGDGDCCGFGIFCFYEKCDTPDVDENRIRFVAG